MPRRAPKVAAALSVLAFLLVREVRDLPRQGSPGRAELARLFAGHRPAAGRLSWSLPHAPAASEAPAVLSRQQSRAAALLEAAAERDGSADALGALAALRLVQGQAGQAVPLLERAVAASPEDVRLLSDLAAALLARAAQGGDARDLLASLAAADRAVAADPTFPPALFNRALALERLSLATEARETWERYLELDPTSGWAGEARAHLAALDRPTLAERWEDERPRLDEAVRAGDRAVLGRLATELPQQVRLRAEEGLLGDWADAVRHGREDEAAAKLAMARTIGRELADRGEHLAADAVAAIDRALDAGGSARREALVAGHLAYREAQSLYDANRIKDAEPLFEQARRSFEQGGSPLAGWAALHLAIARYHRYDLTAARQALGRLLREPEAGRSPALRGRVHWMLGLVDILRGEPAASLAAYQAALATFERMKAHEEVGALHALLAVDYRYLGTEREAWRHLAEALTVSAETGEPRSRQNTLDEAASASLLARQPTIASLFRDEAVRVAAATGDATSHAHAILRRAEALAAEGEHEPAARDLAAARALLPDVIDLDLSRRVEADLRLAEADLVALRDPAGAVEGITATLDFFHGKSNRYPLGRLFLARARARLASGDTAGAEADLERGVAEFEERRRRVTEERLQISFFDRSRDLFDELIRLRLDQGRVEEALAAAERERARSLLDRLGGLLTREARERFVAGLGEPLPTDELRRAVPAGTVILEYALLPDRLAIWVVRAAGVAAVEPPDVDPDVLTARVERFRAALAGGEHGPAVEADAGELYDLLIRPVLPYLTPDELLVVVADRALHAVPFAALRDRRTGRYLLMDHPISSAPSATLFVRAIERAGRAEGHRPPSALAVGDPAFDESSAPGLSRLPHAAAEAAAVAELFPGSELLPSEHATPSAFLAAAGRHAIVHFAGHAVVVPERPLLSHLVLATEEGTGSGLLYAHELYGAELAETQLVALAACRSADGPASGEGVESLARAFLAAGVPTVVASLWDVDDQISARLFEEFYRRLGEGMGVAQALREAQLTFINGRDADRSPAAWGGFQMIGGSHLTSSSWR